jgi:hypothetical protein
MANTQLNNNENSRIQAVLARYLDLRSTGSQRADQAGHLDEDTINAFTESRLDQRQSSPVVSHLVDCSFCRHRTVELVRLAMFFDAQDEPVMARETASEPASVSSVLSGILSRLFGSGEASVFAHEEKPEVEENSSDEDVDPKSES